MEDLMEHDLKDSSIPERESMTTLSFPFSRLFKIQNPTFLLPIFVSLLMKIFSPKNTLGYHGLS